MKLHEYQAKELLAKEGAAVPPGFAATSVKEVPSQDSVKAPLGGAGEPEKTKPDVCVPAPLP